MEPPGVHIWVQHPRSTGTPRESGQTCPPPSSHIHRSPGCRFTDVKPRRFQASFPHPSNTIRNGQNRDVSLTARDPGRLECSANDAQSNEESLFAVVRHMDTVCDALENFNATPVAHIQAESTPGSAPPQPKREGRQGVQNPRGTLKVKARDKACHRTTTTFGGLYGAQELGESLHTAAYGGYNQGKADVVLDDTLMRGEKILGLHRTFLRNRALKKLKRREPPTGADIRVPGCPPLKIFCGTWNCRYQEFKYSVITNKKTQAFIHRARNRRTSPTHLTELESGSEICPTGSQGLDSRIDEPIPGDSLLDHIPMAIVASLNIEAEAAACQLTPTLANENHSGDDPEDAVGRFYRSDSEAIRKSILRSSTRELQTVEGEEQPLCDWIIPGYDVYVISLQETLSDGIFIALAAYLTTVHGFPFRRVMFPEDKISGFGDGAWTQFKSTSVGVWVRRDFFGPDRPVSLVGSKAIPIRFWSGSKGAVTVCLKIWGQYYCFVGCHMPAASPEERSRAVSLTRQRLISFYGGGRKNTGASLENVFHHVLWMGDFNFRTRFISAEHAVEMLKNSVKMLQPFDEWLGPEGDEMRRDGFSEAPIDFPPTYKKKDGRPPIDLRSPDWPELEYETQFFVQWYKGGGVAERLPSWTDRVLKWSTPALSSLLRFQRNKYFSACPKARTLLIASDHSPVGLGLEAYPLLERYQLPFVALDSRGPHHRKPRVV